MAEVGDEWPEVLPPCVGEDKVFGNLPGLHEGPVAGTHDEGPELGGGPKDGANGLGGVGDPRCRHGRVESVSHNGSGEVVLDEPAHLKMCRWCVRAARTLRRRSEAAVRLVEQIDEVFDVHVD